MATITNSTNYIEFADGDFKRTIPKDQISELRLKKDRIVMFFSEGAPITIFPADITSPAWSSLEDLHTTLKGYL